MPIIRGKNQDIFPIRIREEKTCESGLKNRERLIYTSLKLIDALNIKRCDRPRRGLAFAGLRNLCDGNRGISGLINLW